MHRALVAWEKNLLGMGVSICTSTRYDDEWGHELMSLTYCTYLFLCVTVSHYALMGIKHPHTKKCTTGHNTQTVDLSRNFTLVTYKHTLYILYCCNPYVFSYRVRLCHYYTVIVWLLCIILHNIIHSVLKPSFFIALFIFSLWAQRNLLEEPSGGPLTSNW